MSLHRSYVVNRLEKQSKHHHSIYPPPAVIPSNLGHEGDESTGRLFNKDYCRAHEKLFLYIILSTFQVFLTEGCLCQLLHDYL